MKFKTVQEAKDNLPTLSVIAVSYVATKGIGEIKQKIIYKDVNAAWVGNFGKSVKRPW